MLSHARFTKKLSTCLLVLALLCLTPLITTGAQAASNVLCPVNHFTSISDHYHTGWCGLKYYHQNGHKGTDFAAPAKTPIKAIKSGTVIQVENKYAQGEGTAYGNHVRVKHSDGSIAIYAHMTATAILEEGTYVWAGDTIGYVGMTGSATGNHLHLELRKTSAYSSAVSVLDQYNVYTNTVKTQQALRKTASSSGTVVTTIPAGGKVTLTDPNDTVKKANGISWVKAKYGSSTGWLDVSSIKVTGPTRTTKSDAILTKSELPNSTSNKYTIGRYRCTETIKLHAACSTDSKQVSTLPKDAEVIVSDIAGNWGYTTYGGVSGWFNLKYGEKLAIGYFIRYENGNGSGKMKNQFCLSDQENYYADCTFTSNGEGEVFRYWLAYNSLAKKWHYTNASGKSGWYPNKEAPDGYTKTRFYAGGSLRDITSTGGNVIVLKAIYGSPTASEYTISLDPCGGAVETDELLVVPGSPYGPLPIPTRSGYAFLGWFTEADDGTQKISLDTPSRDSTLYAHWIPRSARTPSGAHLEWSSSSYSFPKYITALSKLMVQQGQQHDSDFDPKICYDYLKATDMIGTSNGAEVVRTSTYAETGFLEYYAPEFTFYGSISPENFEDEDAYYAELADLHESNFGLLIKLFTDAGQTSTCWRTVTSISGGEIFILNETAEAAISETYYGISNVHAFQFHGELAPHHTQTVIQGEYCIEPSDPSTSVICTGHISIETPSGGSSPLTPGASYNLLAAGYADTGAMIGILLQPFAATTETHTLEFSFPIGRDIAFCRCFILDDQYQPFCAEPEMTLLPIADLNLLE